MALNHFRSQNFSAQHFASKLVSNASEIVAAVVEYLTRARRIGRR